MSELPKPFHHSTLPFQHKQTGKVRDSYLLDEQRRLLITTDRLSAFDKVLGALPYKGQVLNQLSAWWFEHTTDIIPNHFISMPDPNATLAINVKPFPVEVIVRGYITGITSTALWHRYELGERLIYGYSFPEHLRKNQQLPEPIITPTTKGGATGHDERLTCQEVIEQGWVSAAHWERIQTAALSLFKRGQNIAEAAGLLLVDTKYEFGLSPTGDILLIDEVHTPDSSRYWKADTYFTRWESGLEPENFDKEIIRLAYAEKNYRGEGTPPELPASVWQSLTQRYIHIYERLTGHRFQPGSYPVEQRLTQNLQLLMEQYDVN